MNTTELYQQAIHLIKRNQLEEARAVLVPIRHEAKAAEWIQKIDAQLAKRASPQQAPKSRSGISPLVDIAFAGIFALVTFVAGLLVGGYALDLNPQPTSEPMQSVLVVTATPMPATMTAVPSATPVNTSTAVSSSTPSVASTLPPTSTLMPSETAQSELVSVAHGGKWLYDSDFSALDDSSSHFLILEAEDSIRAWLSNPTPVLIIRCRNHRYEVYIHADTQLESNLNDEVFVQIRYGDTPAFNTYMDESTTGQAIFFPNGRATVQSLLDVNRLVVGFTPFNANPVEAIFDLTGLEEAAQPLFDACGRP